MQKYYGTDLEDKARSICPACLEYLYILDDGTTYHLCVPKYKKTKPRHIIGSVVA